jgi:hypothetical protein
MMHDRLGDLRARTKPRFIEIPREAQPRVLHRGGTELDPRRINALSVNAGRRSKSGQTERGRASPTSDRYGQAIAVLDDHGSAGHPLALHRTGVATAPRCNDAPLHIIAAGRCAVGLQIGLQTSSEHFSRSATGYERSRDSLNPGSIRLAALALKRRTYRLGLLFCSASRPSCFAGSF